MRRKKLVVLAAIALLSLVATAWVAVRATRVMARSVAAAGHTRDVLIAIDRFRGTLAEAESDVRGYVITGEPDFLTHFATSGPAVEGSVRQLRQIVSEDEHQRRHLITLESLVASRLGILRDLTSLAGRQDARSQILTSILTGQEQSRRIGETIDHLRSAELSRLQEQTAAADSARDFATYAPWAMCSIAVAIFALMLVEVTRALQAELEAREEEHAAFKRAKEADQLKDQFLATVSHELRTPLTAIIGWCGVLEHAESPAALLDEGLASIADAARVQSQLVEDLLDISRIAAGRISLCVAELDAADVIERAIASVAPSAREKGIAILRSFDPNPQIVLGDSTRLQQVVSNLLSNSIKFSPPGTTVEVHLRRSASHVEISVHDDGEGIAPELLPHIFDRFRQGASARGRHAGLGLGLSIVKNLVELHGGTVRAESAGRGKGSTFTVQLPLAPKTGISLNAQRLECANASSRFPCASRKESASWRSRTPDAAR